MHAVTPMLLMCFLTVGAAACTDPANKTHDASPSVAEKLVPADEAPPPVITEPPREYSGVWLRDFEGSPFFEGMAEFPARVSDRQYFAVWLDINPTGLGLPPEPTGEMECFPVSAVRLKFVGRRSTYPTAVAFGFGHMGASKSQVTVDRILSFKRLGAPRCGPEVIWSKR